MADPAGSGKTYWWNTQTNEVTPVGAAKPLVQTGAVGANPPAGAVGGANAMGGPMQQGFRITKVLYTIRRIRTVR